MTLRRIDRRWHLYRSGRAVYSGTLAGAMAMVRAVMEVER